MSHPFARPHSLPLLVYCGRHPCPFRHVPSCLASSPHPCQFCPCLLLSSCAQSIFSFCTFRHVIAAWLLLLRLGIRCILVCTRTARCTCATLGTATQVLALPAACRQVRFFAGSAVIFHSNSVPDGDPFTLTTASASNLSSSGNLPNVNALSFPSGPLTHDLVRSRCHTHDEPVLPPHTEFVHLVVLRHGLEQYLLTELSHFSVCGRPACLLHRRHATQRNLFMMVATWSTMNVITGVFGSTACLMSASFSMPFAAE